MAKKKLKSSSKGNARPGRNLPAGARRLILNTIATVIVLSLLGVAFASVQQYVEQRLAFPAEPPRVVLKNRPAWMSDFLADEIAKTARPSGSHSALDYQMLVDVSDMLTHDPRIAPWIKKVVQVRRAYGKQPGDTLEVDCEYRAPVALVHWGDYYWLVDADGIKLPDPYDTNQTRKIMFGRDGRMNIRVIEGVMRPPPESGHKWLGDDLMAGLDLVQLLYGKPYAEEIEKVNVANYAGREDARRPHLVLATRDATEVQWGRAVRSRDSFVEVSPAQKLDYLARIVEKYHRVDGNHSAVDIRFDKVTFPSDDPRGGVGGIQ